MMNRVATLRKRHNRPLVKRPEIRKQNGKEKGRSLVTCEDGCCAFYRDLAKACSLVPPVPPSPEAFLAIELSHVLSQTRMNVGFLPFIPTRVGQSEVVDAAARSLLTTIRQTGRKQDPETSRAACALTYGKTILALQNMLEGNLNSHSRVDDALLATTVLSFIDWILNPGGCVGMHAHIKGCAALLLSVPADMPISGIASTVLLGNWPATFHMPVAMGTPSPFEQDRWLQSRTASPSGAVPPLLDRAVMVWKNLYIRLPRLIATARELRRLGTACPEAVRGRAYELAQDLLVLKDADAERGLLNAVKIATTPNASDREIVSHSYLYTVDGTFSGATAYSQTRIWAHRLYSKLQRLEGALPCEGVTASIEDLIAENKRMATNILMSWTFATFSGGIGLWSMRLGLLAVWAVTHDIKQDDPGGFETAEWSPGLSMLKLRSWLLQRYRDLHMKTRIFRGEELDEASDLLVGGTLKGFLLDILQ